MRRHDDRLAAPEHHARRASPSIRSADPDAEREGGIKSSNFLQELEDRDSGTISFRSSSRFADNSGVSLGIPVILPPRCARLTMIPLSTMSSLQIPTTIGIVLVDFRAALRV